ELRLRGRLPGPEVGPSTGDEVEHRDAFGDSRRMVERWWCLHDAMAEADAFGALRHRGEEHLRRARVAVLLEEVVLHFPHVMEAEGVGKRALLQRVADELGLRAVRPWPRQ